MANCATAKKDVATFGMGCFWCGEAIFSQIDGVTSVQSGYAGGHMKNPTYRQVCTGDTGHAEVIQVEFDPDVVSYTQLLEVFFKMHDPTTLNRQGADVGTQYRSAVFTHSPEQEHAVKEAIKALNDAGVYKDPIVTEVAPFTVFYPAEAYHNDYFKRNPNEGYCRLVIQPKVDKFKEVFKALQKSK